ncbi:MAG: hypothetical protein CHACPFDD_03396 [Phycisphaerae bacterium]|nr:hypothetical protein [Phycisphaerae bacterium]
MFANTEEGMLGSCMSYSKAMAMLAQKWGVPNPGPSRGKSRLEDLLKLVQTIVREEARRAADEAVFRAFRVAARCLPSDPRDGLFVPAQRIRINTADVGLLEIRSFRGHRDDALPEDDACHLLVPG